MANIRLTIPVTPPGTMGTTVGGHIYVEAPDQSSTPAALMDGSTLMDGTTTMQGLWAPIDCGKIPYVAAQQPWTVTVGVNMGNRTTQQVRVYVASYSDAIDMPLVRYGLTGATPSYVVTISPEVLKKPLSGSNVTPFLVPGITGAVSGAVSVGGKLKRPIGITVDLTGLAGNVSSRWAYQLLGFVNGDITQDPVLATGVITDLTAGLYPAGPDGISIPHTFGPEEPTAITSITVYAVAGEIASDRNVAGAPPRTPGAFSPNNIVPGITASCVISIGTTGGVTDPTAFIQTLLDTSVGVTGAVFGVLPLGVDNTRIALLAVDTTKLAALAVTAAKLGNSSVTAVAIANLAVGTVAIQTAAISTALIANAAITNALIGNLAVGTAQIQLLAVGGAQIANASITNAHIHDLDASKITGGTITATISLTSPVINGGSISGTTLTLTSNTITTTVTNATDPALGLPAGLNVVSNSGPYLGWRTLVFCAGVSVIDPGNVQRAFLGWNGGPGGQLTLSANPGVPAVFVNGNSGYTGTLAAAVAAGKNVMAGFILN